MKTKKHDMRLRELFSSKLGNAKITPSPSVKVTLMRKLAFKEFMRFTPSKFNIYYLAGIIVAGLTTSVLIFSGDKSVSLLPEIGIPEKIFENVRRDTISFNKVQSDVNKSGKFTVNSSNDINTKNTDNSKTGFVESAQKLNVHTDKKLVRPTTITDTLTSKILVPEVSARNNKLQGGLKTENHLFEASVIKGCVPLNVKFRNLAGLIDSCRWTFGDGGFSKEVNPDWIFDVEGVFRVVLNVFMQDGLTGTFSQIITVYPKPQAQFEISPENAILPDDEIRFFNYSLNASQYRWNFGDGSSSDLYEPHHKYLNYGTYDVSLVAKSEFGCIDSLIVLNAFSGSAYFIDFPNAFIPNDQGPTGGYYSSKSDEAAQVFHPNSTGVSEYQLKIFSKRGILIFESKDLNIGWDGYFKGQLSEPGVYVWKVRGNFRNGEPFIKMGDVTLIRN